MASQRKTLPSTTTMHFVPFPLLVSRPLDPLFLPEEAPIDERFFIPIKHSPWRPFRKKGPPHVLENFGLVPFFQATPARGGVWILVREVLPPGSCPEYPQDSLKDQAVIGPGAPSFRSSRRLGNERLNLLLAHRSGTRLVCLTGLTSGEMNIPKTKRVQGLISCAISRGYIQSEVLQPLLNKC